MIPVIKIIDFKTARSAFIGVAPSELYELVRWCFMHKDEFQMPVKARLSQSDGDYYACMPCMHEGLDLAIAKMIGRHVAAAVQAGVPSMSSDIMCYEASTGKLLALMDGEYLTTLRTGACAAFSALEYVRDDYSEIGLIGLGNIMTVFMDVFVGMIGSRRVTVRLFRHKGQEERFAGRFAACENITFIYCDTYEDVIGSSDLVVSAVTKADTNFCEDCLYRPGVTVVPIMTLGFQNCDLFFDKVITDEVDQIRGFKYFNSFKYVANTDEVLHGLKPGRTSQEERILVYNYGLASLDLVFALKLLQLVEGRGSDIRYEVCNEKFFMK